LVINLLIVPRIEPGMIYFPTKEMGQDPASVGLKYEDVFLKTADGKKIHGWFIENNTSDKVILLFHGNGGNISHRLSKIKLLHFLPANVFIIDYHGYGKSEGEPCEQNLYLDAKAAYDYLIKEKKYTPSQVIVMGTSLGGGVATYLATQERVGALILESTFTSIYAMAPRKSPLYRRPIVWVRSRFDNLENIEKVNVPILIIHSEQDEVIPYQMSVALYEKANKPKKLVLLEKYKHGGFMTTPEYIEGLQKVLQGDL